MRFPPQTLDGGEQLLVFKVNKCRLPVDTVSDVCLETIYTYKKKVLPISDIHCIIP